MLGRTDFTCEIVAASTTSGQMAPPDSNWCPTIGGHPIRLRGRAPAAASGWDGVLAAPSALGDRSSHHTFTVREVDREMTARGSLPAGPSRSEGAPDRLLEAGPLEPGDADGDREGGSA